MKKILIAGGSGLVGKQLSKLLMQNDYEVAWLSRSNKSPAHFQSYKWNPELGVIDPEAIAFADVIIVLSGENISADKWTDKFKKKIIKSRLQAAETINNALKNHPNNVSHVIAASAIGYYGDRNDKLVDETSEKGFGFLADTTQQWENAYSNFVFEKLAKNSCSCAIYTFRGVNCKHRVLLITLDARFFKT
jgi:NAD dependent epimerase/dehydratase family enzyme